eukprot:TRINITY_DN44390_c0_g1_i1.p1 TRINITY_DN44390_c0_g1~~TRINITY_DN44390_c0_g1_i1.p1  ORF type:complete len:213 (+),score=67.47 TRINITY_DN44390_c0_g1_i1:114-752(+)
MPHGFESGRVVLIRHGNTNKPADGSPETLVERDLPRALTDKGREQCAAARAGYWAEVAPRLKVLLHSKAGRCRDTAAELCGGELPKGIPVRSVDVLYGCQFAPEVEAVFAKTGYCSVATFREAGGEQPLRAWEEAAFAECQSVLRECLGSTPLADGEVVGVFCHALYTQALMRSFAAAFGVAEAARQHDDVNLQEVEGFEVSAKGVRHLARL